VVIAGLKTEFISTHAPLHEHIISFAAMAKTGNWCSADDQKLEALIRQRGNGITINTDKDNVKRICSHWPHRAQNSNFKTLIRGKLEKFEIHGAVTGRRAGEYCFDCVHCIFSSLLTNDV
jgi:hypothetical protein